MSKQLDPLGTTTPELHCNKTVIIVGDSWGCGEWENDTYSVAHKGLEQYLLDDGYRVINASIPGGSNIRSLISLYEALATNDFCSNDIRVFFFCTDWVRDLKKIPHFIDGLVSDDYRSEFFLIHNYDKNFVHKVWYRLLEKLEKIANSKNIPIGLIGGCADTVDVGDAHPGVYVACRSLTNLCVNDDDKVEQPVFGIFNSTQLENQLKSIIGKKITEDFLDDMQHANTRQLVWKNNKKWFYPDGVHANRSAHKKLFDFLKDKKHI